MDPEGNDDMSEANCSRTYALVLLVSCHTHYRQERQARLSRDPKVTIYTPKLINNATRFMLTPILIFIVLAPTIVCNRIESSTARLCVMIGATTTFITLLALLTKSRTIELAVAGAT